MPDAVDRNSAFAGARVVITGGLGFIGSTLALRLVELGADLLLVDNLFSEYGGNLFNVAPIRERVSIEIADIRDVQADARPCSAAAAISSISRRRPATSTRWPIPRPISPSTAAPS